MRRDEEGRPRHDDKEARRDVVVEDVLGLVPAREKMDNKQPVPFFLGKLTFFPLVPGEEYPDDGHAVVPAAAEVERRPARLLPRPQHRH